VAHTGTTHEFRQRAEVVRVTVRGDGPKHGRPDGVAHSRRDHRE